MVEGWVSVGGGEVVGVSWDENGRSFTCNQMNVLLSSVHGPARS